MPEPSGTGLEPRTLRPDPGRVIAAASPIRLARRTSPDRLIVAGHQPELFHPGVWVKNFALAGHGPKARRDRRSTWSSTTTRIKPAAIRVPVVADDPRHVTAGGVPFDRTGGRPVRGDHVADRGLFDTFPERLANLTDGWGYEPLAVPTWPALRADVDRGAPLGRGRFASPPRVWSGSGA